MRPIVVLAVAALALRLLVLLMTPGYAPAGDAADYERHAASIAGLGSYPSTLLGERGGPTAFRPPAYPYALAGVYEVFGRSWTAARLLNALLGTASVLLLYALVARLWSRRLARWAAGIAALAPGLVWITGSLLSENLFTPLVLASALCVALTRERAGDLRLSAAAGGLCGLAILTRNNGVLLLAPLALGLLGLRPGRSTLAAPAVALGVVALVLTPWAVRNADAFGRFAPLGTQSGFTLSGQYNPAAAAPGPLQAVTRLPQDVPELRGFFDRGLDEGELDAELRSAALSFAASNPLHVVTAGLLNSLRLFDLGPGSEFVSTVAYDEIGVPAQQRGGLHSGSLLLLVLAVAGAVALARRRDDRGPLWLWLFPALLIAGIVPFVGTPRYRVPVDPFLALLAAVAIVSWRDRRRDRAALPG